MRSLEGRIFGSMRRLLEVRKRCEAFAGNEMDVVDTGNPHVFGFVRRHAGDRVLALANFSEGMQKVSANAVRLYGLGYSFTDLITGDEIALKDDLRLDSYRFVWLLVR